MDDDLWGAYEEEENFVALGNEDGVRRGKSLGYIDAWELGARKGYEIGVELGYYMGCMSLWESSGTIISASKEIRARKGIEELRGLLQDYPKENVQDIDLKEKIDAIRSLFKEVSSVLGLTRQYSEKQASGGYDF